MALAPNDGTLFLLAILFLHLLHLAATCPTVCKCDPEGGGKKVVCEGGDLSTIFSDLPSNTQRLLISGLSTGQSLRKEDLIRRAMPPSIFQLAITKSALQEVESDVFATTLASVQILDLSSNSIAILAPGAFNGLSRLRTLNLSSNRLDDLGASLEPLVSLQQLDLSHNFISELKPAVFQHQSSLSLLLLNHNPFRSLGGAPFQPLTFLTELRARGCGIFFIQEDFFSAVTRLTLLDVGDNRLSAFPSSTRFSEMKYLKHLYLDGNELMALQPHQFADLSLLTLSLARNRISSISADSLDELTVEDLDLSENKLLELKGQSLLPVAPHLLTLNVANNPIRILDENTFKGLHLLKSVNVSACSLNDLPAKAFSNLFNLRSLDASWNRLQNISEDLIKIFNRLSTINLQQNPWHCDCHIVPLRDWMRSRTSLQKLTCLPGRFTQDCSTLKCTSPDPLVGQQMSNLSDTSVQDCSAGSSKEGLPLWTQIVIVVACLLFSLTMLAVTFFLWKRGRTRKGLKEALNKTRGSRKKQKNTKEWEDEEEEGEKIEPFKDCDNESLKESHRSFVFRHYFDTLVTDPALLEPTSPSQGAPSRQQDSLYSSDSDLYEASANSRSMALGIESTV